MTEIKGFIISLITASAASAVIEGFVPEGGGLKKYLKYAASLAILLMLLAPLRSLISAIPSLAEDFEAGGYSIGYDSVDAVARVNSLTALHISRAVCEKFSLDESEVSASVSDGVARIELKRHFGIFERDICEYVAANFGVAAEVVFYE